MSINKILAAIQAEGSYTAGIWLGLFLMNQHHKGTIQYWMYDDDVSSDYRLLQYYLKTLVIS